jgi:hypothetical protein
MKPTVYTVHAYRWGDRENHSYLVGVYSKKLAAIKAGEATTEWRGGKYECEVIQWKLDDYESKKVIVPLPQPQRLHRESGPR